MSTEREAEGTGVPMEGVEVALGEWSDEIEGDGSGVALPPIRNERIEAALRVELARHVPHKTTCEKCGHVFTYDNCQACDDLWPCEARGDMLDALGDSHGF
jgi:hypothetical protein